jgi:hypothetical protein
MLKIVTHYCHAQAPYFLRTRVDNAVLLRKVASVQHAASSSNDAVLTTASANGSAQSMLIGVSNSFAHSAVAHTEHILLAQRRT